MYYEIIFISDFKFFKKNCFIDGIRWLRVYVNKMVEMVLMFGSRDLKVYLN